MRTLGSRARSACGNALGASIASAAPVAETAVGTWQTNGRVTAIAVVGSTAYIGGDFTAVRPAGKAAGKSTVKRNHAAAIDLTTGALLPSDPTPTAACGRSPRPPPGVFGGEFSSVGDASASHIAEVDPNGGKRVSALRQHQMNFGATHSRSLERRCTPVGSSPPSTAAPTPAWPHWIPPRDSRSPDSRRRPTSRSSRSWSSPAATSWWSVDR